MNDNIIIGEDLIDISKLALKKFKEIYSEKNGNLNIALSGGNTPKEFYNLLSMEKEIKWDNIHIFLVDERYVNWHNKDSNSKLILDNLTSCIKIPIENIHLIPFLKSIDHSKKCYEQKLIQHFNLKNDEIPSFDIIFLGIGTDGHIGSIFPEIFEENKENFLTLTDNKEKYGYERISMGIKMLNMSSNIIFLVSGDNKADILKDILINKNENLPATKVKALDKTIFLVDKAAYKNIDL